MKAIKFGWQLKSFDVKIFTEKIFLLWESDFFKDVSRYLTFGSWDDPEMLHRLLVFRVCWISILIRNVFNSTNDYERLVLSPLTPPGPRVLQPSGARELALITHFISLSNATLYATLFRILSNIFFQFRERNFLNKKKKKKHKKRLFNF